MRMPCSVKARGSFRRPPQDLEDANRDFKLSNSARVSWNMKSLGKRSRLRLTCSLSRFVGTRSDDKMLQMSARFLGFHLSIPLFLALAAAPASGAVLVFAPPEQAAGDTDSAAAISDSLAGLGVEAGEAAGPERPDRTRVPGGRAGRGAPPPKHAPPPPGGGPPPP